MWSYQHCGNLCQKGFLKIYDSHTKPNWIHGKILFISLINERTSKISKNFKWLFKGLIHVQCWNEFANRCKNGQYSRAMKYNFWNHLGGHQLHCQLPDKIYLHVTEQGPFTLLWTSNFYITQESLCPFLNITQAFNQPSWSEGISPIGLQAVTKHSTNQPTSFA